MTFRLRGHVEFPERLFMSVCAKADSLIALPRFAKTPVNDLCHTVGDVAKEVLCDYGSCDFGPTLPAAHGTSEAVVLMDFTFDWDGFRKCMANTAFEDKVFNRLVTAKAVV